MAELNVRLVAVDRQVWEGVATSVVAKTVEGEIGILPGHEPVLGLLVDGAVRITGPDGETTAAVHGGFLSVEKDNVSVLAETAELAQEIDVERAERALERARSEVSGDAPTAEQEAAVRRAESRLRVAPGSRSH